VCERRKGELGEMEVGCPDGRKMPLGLILRVEKKYERRWLRRGCDG
jgi:hypothetical protein